MEREGMYAHFEGVKLCRVTITEDYATRKWENKTEMDVVDYENFCFCFNPSILASVQCTDL